MREAWQSWATLFAPLEGLQTNDSGVLACLQLMTFFVQILQAIVQQATSATPCLAKISGCIPQPCLARNIPRVWYRSASHADSPAGTQAFPAEGGGGGEGGPSAGPPTQFSTQQPSVH